MLTRIHSQIVDFLESEYSTAHYEAMAKMVEENLRTRLEAGGVTKFKLSRRAKNHESLKEKLIIRNRNRKIDYQSFQEIKKDIVDLAGVRVILYMPTQEDNHKVKEVIQKEWGKDIMPRIHPPPRNIAETQRGRQCNLLLLLSPDYASKPNTVGTV